MVRWMSPDELPEPVREFLAQCAGSPDELGMLLMLMTASNRWWNARSAAQEIGLTEARARQVLDRLVSCNLLDIKVSNEVRYRFRPGTPTLQHRASALLALYREHGDVVLQWLPADRSAGAPSLGADLSPSPSGRGRWSGQ
jgi:hypothetical protein